MTKRNHDSTGAMAAAWFGTPGCEAAVEAVFGEHRDPIIVVSYKSEVLGKGEFWRGPASQIDTIHNICAQQLARLTSKDGQPHKDGMWRSTLAATPAQPTGEAMP